MLTKELHNLLKDGNIDEAIALLSNSRAQRFPKALKDSLSFLISTSKLYDQNHQKLSRSIKGVQKTSLAERIAIGRGLLAPVLLVFYKRLFLRLEKSKIPTNRSLFFLAREGYLLQKGFDILQQRFNLTQSIKSKYLIASRVLLSKVAASRPESETFIVRHQFSGSLRSFFMARLDFDIKNIYKQCDEFNYARDKALEILKIIREMNIFIKEEEAYKEYLSSIGFGAEGTEVVDLGYSGTIQSLLSIVCGTETHGYYMLTTKDAHRAPGSSATFDGIIASHLEWGKNSMLDRSIILESLLTSPTGSAIGLKSPSQFIFGKTTAAQDRFDELDDIFNHAMSLVIDAWDLNFRALSTKEIVDLYAETCSNVLFKNEAVVSLLEVEDIFGGNSVLSVSERFAA